nr:MAG TPA: hypothetical protein [Caudoviricetes sp.]
MSERLQRCSRFFLACLLSCYMRAAGHHHVRCMPAS